jgi:hypothetical protein
MHRITSTSRIPSTTEQAERHISAFSNGQSDTLTLRPGSARRRPSGSPIPKNEFLSPASAPPLPTKSSERTYARSQPGLPVSRSAGFQNQPRTQSSGVLASVIRNPSREKENENEDVINGLRERLIEVEKERDEARRIVTEVRMALHGSYTLLP